MDFFGKLNSFNFSKANLMKCRPHFLGQYLLGYRTRASINRSTFIEKIDFYAFFMLQLQGPKNIFWLLTADNAGALTVCYNIKLVYFNSSHWLQSGWMGSKKVKILIT